MTHSRPGAEKWSSCWIEGRAMFTMVPSRITIIWTAQISTSASPACLCSVSRLFRTIVTHQL